MTTTKIQWTDATWNPVRGCTEISPGCAHCYAKTFAERWRGVKGHPYEQGFDVRLVPEKLDEPLRWKRPRMVFVNSMSDLFHEYVPDEFIDRVVAVMALAPKHTFQVLTKRPERMLRYMNELTAEDVGEVAERMYTAWKGDWKHRWDLVGHDDTKILPIPNVWLGVSVEDQKRADERIPLLLQTPAAVRFLSCEPLLGPINLHFGRSEGLPTENEPCRERHWLLDWVIVGGESGPGARQAHLEWFRDIIRQCKAANVPVFMKQTGQCVLTGRTSINGPSVATQAVMLKDKKGGTMSEWPSDLRIREFPK